MPHFTDTLNTIIARFQWVELPLLSQMQDDSLGVFPLPYLFTNQCLLKRAALHCKWCENPVKLNETELPFLFLNNVFSGFSLSLHHGCRKV